MKNFLGLLSADRPATSRYAEEVFAHAGFFASAIVREELTGVADEYGIILLAGELRLNETEREALENFVIEGGTLIAIGGTSGLEQLFGVESQIGLGEGYIQIRRKKHPITMGLESSLHTFGGVAAQATNGVSLARMRDSLYRPTLHDAIVERRIGKGLTIFIAPDLFGSIVRIQQGIYVDQDGIPASDGSAPINDGILKCEDGMTLNFEIDRTLVDGENRIFYHPIADELRELVIKSVLYAARRKRLPLPMLWYYPRNLPSLGHISHDSDGNNRELAWSLLKFVQELGVKTTWCVIEPGYAADFYAAIKADGGEIALHYDALDGRPRTSWGEHQLRGQHDWLTHAANVRVVSNKNHYTRWEGRLDFFRWCAAIGLQCDQSRGPSKRGTIGYPLGGSHPWFPIDDGGDFIDCLELNLQTQDLVNTCPDYFGRYWVEQAVKHHGIAHLLFHPAHIEEPGVADALRMVVDYGRKRGLEWWTCAQINDWERARRGVRLQSYQKQHSGMTYCFSAERPLQDATLLFLKPRGEYEQVERYGFTFQKVEMDLAGEKEVHLKSRKCALCPPANVKTEKRN
ncbi:MAG: hypothetical protein ACE5PV_16525 [Candidatus Poribacteria bacterium]